MIPRTLLDSTGFLIGGGPVFAHAQGQHPVVVAHFILRVSAHLAQAVVDPRIGLHVAQVRIVRRKRSEEHTSELQSLMRISYAVFCLKKKNIIIHYSTKLHNTRNET